MSRSWNWGSFDSGLYNECSTCRARARQTCRHSLTSTLNNNVLWLRPHPGYHLPEFPEGHGQSHDRCLESPTPTRWNCVGCSIEPQAMNVATLTAVLPTSILCVAWDPTQPLNVQSLVGVSCNREGSVNPRLVSPESTGLGVLMG